MPVQATAEEREDYVPGQQSELTEPLQPFLNPAQRIHCEVTCISRLDDCQTYFAASCQLGDFQCRILESSISSGKASLHGIRQEERECALTPTLSPRRGRRARRRCLAAIGRHYWGYCDFGLGSRENGSGGQLGTGSG